MGFQPKTLRAHSDAASRRQAVVELADAEIS
jgi:hypothetical protein